MGTQNTDDNESNLRGGALDGAERKTSVEHTAYEKKRNPDTVLRVDDEEDTLYDDGLEIEDEGRPQSSVDGKDDNSR